MRSFYIGIMTGNSMDAVDVVYAEVGAHHIQPIYTLSEPFSADMQHKTQALRTLAQKGLPRHTLEQHPLLQEFHQSYTDQIAAAVTRLITENKIELNSLSAICSHGKTLDHQPASIGNKHPYTLQIGSGKMLADSLSRRLSTSNIPPPPRIRVLYDFRSDDIMNGGEGAPLIPPLNALTAIQDKTPDRIDINAGNTANLCLIRNGKTVAGWDVGPCNEYMDYVVRRYTDLPFDKDGKLALSGKLDKDLLRTLFNIGAAFYEKSPPKSGDPTYYHTTKIEAFQHAEKLADNLYTAAYFAAYLIVYALHFIPGEIPADFSLFGGGWKNPVLLQSLQNLLNQRGFILPEHTAVFADIYRRCTSPVRCEIHPNGQWMESLLWARMGYCFDHQIPWTTPDLTSCRTPTVCGIEAVSDPFRTTYDDLICRAYKGWQTNSFAPKK